MIKRKKPVKKSAKRKTGKHALKLNYPLWLTILFAAVLIVIFGVVFTNANKIEQAQKLAGNSYHAKLMSHTYHPKAIVYPSVTPSPTPVPLSGFCLRVPVLMYHHIQPENIAKGLGQTALSVDNGIFDQQMQYLVSNGYTTFFANELANALITHTALPAKSVVITLDDGYADSFTYALPILQKYNLKANMMLSTGLMENQDMLSWDQVKGLKSSGLIYFTNHTWSHYAISRGSQDKIETEIDTAKAQIQQYTGQVTNMFTYPYGAFNANAIQTLQKKGYIGAFSEIPGQYQCDNFLMTLHRTRIGNSPLSYYGI